MDFVKRYKKALETFSKDSNEIVVQVCKLGYPSDAQHTATFGVYWDEITKKIKFEINDAYQKLLDDDEFNFLVGHEAIHLLHGHVQVLMDEFEKLKKLQKTDKEIIRFKKKFNIAADCVVNDSLVNLYKFKPVLTVLDEKKGRLFYGKDCIKKDCHDMTVMEVFHLLDDEMIDNTPTSLDDPFEHLWESFYDSNGKLKQSFVDTIEKFIEKNIENSSLSDDDLDKVSQLKKQMQKSTGTKPGTMKIGAYRPVDNLSKVALNWNRIFFQLSERKKIENHWNKPNKKLISVYPDILMPTYAPEEKEDIFVAIDASGSIDHAALSLFISVLKNVPKSFNIQAISFDTACYEYDVKSNEKPKGGGGTNFGIIEQWIQDNLKKYPKIVFVLTDGDGTYVDPQYPERWCWLLYGMSVKRYCQDMKNFNIKELMV